MTKNWTNTSAPLPNAYTPEQEDEFRDVFYTMQDTDVAGWVRSLQLRGIALPDNIKDECSSSSANAVSPPIPNTPHPTFNF